MVQQARRARILTAGSPKPRMMSPSSHFIFLLLVCNSCMVTMVRSVDLLDEATLQAEELQAQQELKYGVDVSFPMHHQFGINGDSTTAVRSVPTSPPLQQFTRDRRNFYQKFLAGCINSFGSENCLRSEQERIDMSLRQPATMKNLTKGLGFRKLKVPETLFEPLKEFWDRNQHEQISEFWPAGSTIVNHWGSLPSVVKVENDTLIGGGDQLTDFVWGTMRGIVAEWTGHELKQASMYGIRVYKTGAVLTTHVDRQPLVSSAIINVAQDVDEPWPLEVIGTDGMAYNVTMEPGDLVLYESHSLLHGRPFPLKGRYMANLFVHFEPLHPLGQEAPVKKDSDIPVYRRPMESSGMKCIPTKNKKGNVYCRFESEA